MPQAAPALQEEADRAFEGRSAVGTPAPLTVGMSAGAKCVGISRASPWKMRKCCALKVYRLRPGLFRVRRTVLVKLVGAS